MAKIGRMAGAIVVHTQDEYFRVGYTKEPCDYAAHGFETPPESDGAQNPVVRLQQLGPVAPLEPVVIHALEGSALAECLAERMLIVRNASVSERLWRLVARFDEEGECPPGPTDADWLVTMPGQVWDIVRDTVLRCS